MSVIDLWTSVTPKTVTVDKPWTSTDQQEFYTGFLIWFVWGQGC